MELKKIVEIIGSIITSVMNIPEIYHAIKYDDVSKIDYRAQVLILTNCITWGTYAYFIQDYGLVIGNTITSLSTMFVIYLKFSHNKK